MNIQSAAASDIPEIQAIYAHHVLHGSGTFEEVPPSVEEVQERFAAIVRRGWSFLVATDATGRASAGRCRGGRVPADDRGHRRF